MDKLVSIVLPTYNGEKYLRQSIESVLSQSYKNLELIIVNDCSNDNTEVIIGEYVKQDDRIVSITNPQNYKLPKSLNIGFNKAKGEYLTWTSDDNYYMESAIREMVDYLEFHQDKIAVCSDYVQINTINNEVRNKVVDNNIETLIFEGNSCGACFLYRASVAREIGNYDEEKNLVEDYDWWLRMGLVGEIGRINKNLYYYRKHENSLTTQRKLEITQKARILRQSYLQKYLHKFPYLKQTQKIKIATIEGLMIELGQTHNMDLIEKINSNKEISRKTLYKLYKSLWKETLDSIYLKAIKKLGLFYKIKALIANAKNKDVINVKVSNYENRLQKSEWGEIYNVGETKQVVDRILNGNYFIQTEEILKIVSKGEKVLEIGSGTGESSIALALAGCCATALDYEQKCLELTKNVALHFDADLRLVHHDALKPLPFEKLEFDFIFHAGLMEHFYKEERIEMFKGWRPYCKRMVSMVPNASSLAYRVGKAMQEQKGTWKYGLEIPIHSQIEEFVASGWSVEKEYSIGARHALSFLDKKHPLRKALLHWIETNPCEDECFQGYLLVTIGVNNDVKA